MWHRSCLCNPMVLLIQRGFERVVMKNIASPVESASCLLSSALLKFSLLICLGAQRDNMDPSRKDVVLDIPREHYLLQTEHENSKTPPLDHLKNLISGITLPKLRNPQKASINSSCHMKRKKERDKSYESSKTMCLECCNTQEL